MDSAAPAPPVATRDTVRRRNRLLLAAAGCAVFIAAAAIPEQAILHGPVVCPLKFATGLDCPLCGMTRAFVFAAHGDVAAAFAFNPGWPLAVAALAALVGLSWRDARNGTERTARSGRWLLRHAWLVIALGFALTALRWVVGR